MKNITWAILSAMVLGSGSLYAEDQAAPQAAPPAISTPVAAPASAPANITVDKMAVGTAIENKEISGEAAQFDGSVSRVYCWTKVSTDQTPVTLKHVWSADGKKEAEVPLEIKYVSGRTWSSKTVWPGSWKVEVTDDQGKVLSSKEFTVTKEVAAPAPSAAAPPATSATPPAAPQQVGQ